MGLHDSSTATAIVTALPRCAGGAQEKRGAFAVGERVKGKYMDGFWYTATIEKVEGDMFVLRWDDGDTKDRIKSASQLQTLTGKASNKSQEGESRQEPGRRTVLLENAPQAKASNGRQVPLLTVIAETLTYVRKEAMEEINKSQMASCIGIEEVQWVVTVPAIWKDEAKVKCPLESPIDTNK